MKKQIYLKSIFSGVLILALSSPAAIAAGEHGGSEMEYRGSAMEHKGSMAEHKGSGMSPEQEAMMAKWKEYSTPGDDHAVLNALVGNWSYTMKHWMKAGAPAEESTGNSESAWIMGGRYVEENVSGMSMGLPFNGTSIMGYNNGSKQYSSYWFDNMSTGSMFGEGVFDAQAKTISSSGTFYCPIRSGETAYRSVLTITDETSHLYEMYMTEVDGVEFLAMQINYTRK